MNVVHTKDDPVSKYFKPLSLAERANDLLFYFVGMLSVASLVVSKNDPGQLYNFVQVGFLVLSLTMFFLGVAIKLRFAPRADERRRGDFLSKAFDVPFSHEQTQGYYNNDLIDPNKRIAAQTMENTLFTKTITARMLIAERSRVGAYVVLWLIVAFNRTSEFAIIAVTAQALFSGQVLEKLLRLEWLSHRSEQIYNDLYSLFQTLPNKAVFAASALKAFASYEAAKSTAQVLLSDKIFNEINPTLSTEWDGVKRTLKI